MQHHRHDISDKLWGLIKDNLPGGAGYTGRPANNNRSFINAVFWIFRTGAPWRDLPPDYGDWKNTHRRFSRWRDRGVWENVLEVVVGEPDYMWLMIDATFVKCHKHSAGAVGGNQEMSISKGGSIVRYTWPWMRMMPLRTIVTDGTTNDCTKAEDLIKGFRAKYLVADKGYDTNEIISLAKKKRMVLVIPSKSNRKEQRLLHKHLYKKRHKVENAFLKMKEWRGIATRYCKNVSSFEAAVHICCIMMWGKLL